MPSRSKAKGNKFELDMCRFFNALYETEEFARTPNSGAIMGRSNWGRKQGLAEDVKRTLGSDIIVPDWFRFAVECKHYKDTPTYDKLIKSPGDSTVNQWLGEVMFDAINLNLHPMLIFKTNNKGTHVALPAYFIPFIEEVNYYVKYQTFIIFGLDVLEENAIPIRDAATGDTLEQYRTLFYDTPYVKELLKILEEK